MLVDRYQLAAAFCYCVCGDFCLVVTPCRFHCHKFAANLDERQAKLCKYGHCGNRTRGCYIEAFAIRRIVRKNLGALRNSGYVVKRRQISGLFDVFYALRRAVKRSYRDIGSEYCERKRRKACAAANVYNLCTLGDIRAYCK